MIPASDGVAVSAERVSRHYQMGSALIRAVDDVTLEVCAGEFLALLGSSGSGKSTLLNLMAGLDRPTSGTIFAHGRNLSEMSRLELARALVNRPALLLADEPTGNLDSATGEGILLLLREIQQSLGMTIVLVTHERPLAERFADRIATVADGRLVSDGVKP